MQTLLVVDDSRVDRRLVGGLLTKTEQYEVIYAEDGREALQRIELDIPDAVLTDLHMPEMNGLDLVQAIKSDYPLIPVVLMTAQGSEELAVEALRLGAASYVTKRRLGEDLIPTVRQILDAAAADRGQTRLMNRIVNTETCYVLPNDTKLVHTLVQQMREILRSMRVFPENDRLRIGIAFEEALLNSLYHGNLEVSSELRDQDQNAYENLARERCDLAPYAERQIFVEVSLTQETVRFLVRDEGPGFDPNAIPNPTDPEFLDRPSGRGMLLMKSFMDEVHYNDTGNQVVMLRRVPQAEPGEEPEPEADSEPVDVVVEASVFDDDDDETVDSVLD